MTGSGVFIPSRYLYTGTLIQPVLGLAKLLQTAGSFLAGLCLFFGTTFATSIPESCLRTELSIICCWIDSRRSYLT